MNCKACGKPINKGDRFILVGLYPSKWKRMNYYYWFDGPENFGDICHEACFYSQIQESKQKCVKP